LSISRLFLAVTLLAALLQVPPEASFLIEGGLNAAARRPSPPEVGCEACLVVADTGRALFERNARAELPNASTTKMMTALLTVQAGVEEDQVTVSGAAAGAGGGGLDLEEGEVWPAESLLNALLLTSSNDAAVALAEQVAGSEEAFVELMNAEAGRLRLRNTAFVTSHGLDAPGHYSSAHDLAVIAERLLAEPLLKRIVAQSQAKVEGPEGTVTLTNRNLLLETYRGAIGVKTGYTLGAGNALVGAALRNGRRLITVVLRSSDSFADTRALLDYGFARLRRALLLRRGDPVGTVVLDPAGSVRAVASRSARGLAPPDSLEISFLPDTEFDLPLEAGDEVGVVLVESGDQTIARVPAVTLEEVSATSPSWAAEGLATVLSWAQWIGPAG
jgi:serine-type D-Ala-D-Ala carboxypeptidase (penicillin-binding protein 5/6)